MMTGNELLQEMHTQNIRKVVSMVISATESLIFAELLRYGVVDYLIKIDCLASSIDYETGRRLRVIYRLQSGKNEKEGNGIG